MSTHPRDLDAATIEQHDVLSARREVDRATVEIAWSDADGNHSAVLDRRMVVGAAGGVDLIVNDPSVSRIHAELDLRDDGVWIRDLGSMNGTFVGDILVTGARIPRGSSIRIGGTTLHLTEQARSTAFVDLWPTERFGALLGRSTAMRELFATLAQVALTESSVLIHGETGTGKELVANAIHEASSRAEGPFVVIDCAALPENLLEAELFGHAKGSFTGAVGARPGALETAEGGTIFLDEIGELPIAMQPKLLRAIESRTVRRLGETAYRAINVRFVSATHRDLRTMVNAGAFREDLYFRLAVLPIAIPPLRERREDIPLLVDQFLRGTHGTIGSVEPGVLSELSSRPWLGNVRELRNFVERMIAFGPDRALSMAPPPTSTDPWSRLPTVPTDRPFKQGREAWTDHFDRDYLRQLLEQHGRNVSAVARAAGIDRTYIYRLMQKHGL
jgi:DNA-binding NtrC family response regulator